MDDPAAGRWCDCLDRPVYSLRPPLSTNSGTTTVLDHPDGCSFPDRVCDVRAHRVQVHEACGREVLMLFCACGEPAFTWDEPRDWWVHYGCGWPTRAWFEAQGRPALEHLAGLRPVTYHEFRVHPRTPKKAYAALSDHQRAANERGAGTWVRD